MITKTKPATLNTRLKKDTVFAIRLKQIITAIVVGVITLNVLVVLFNYALTIIGSW
ncbi:MAG TPA: hypothetical protein VEC37_14125 [Bacillota bacterium]|nr:hypothetical protein [Bacillota bacterium]